MPCGEAVVAFLFTNKGVPVQIDAEDAELLAPYNWRLIGKGYAAARINGPQVYMARFLIKPGPGLDVDHINGDRLDNRKFNLRACTRQQNLLNRKCVNPLGFKGVTPLYTGKFKAQIKFMGRNKSLGHFDTAAEAGAVWATKAAELHGEYYHP